MERRVYFITDCHLGASHHKDDRENELSLVRFLDSIKESADSVYLLGDILDYWFEYKHVVPRGYVRFFGKIAELADSGIKITWLIGNHDIWIFDYLPKELGIRVIDGALEEDILGKRFHIQHGDAIAGNRKFMIMRKFFRNKLCQWLYSGIHPRWTVGFAETCSRKSRASGQYDELSNDPFIEYCRSQIREGNNADYYVFGHLHRECKVELEKGRWMAVVPAWLNCRGYAVFDGHSLQLHKMS